MFCLVGWIKCGSVVGAHPLVPPRCSCRRTEPPRTPRLPAASQASRPTSSLPAALLADPASSLLADPAAGHAAHTSPPLAALLTDPPPVALLAVPASPPLAVLLTDPAAGRAACASPPLAALLAVPGSPPLVALLVDPTAGRAAHGPHHQSRCSRFPPPRRRPRCSRIAPPATLHMPPRCRPCCLLLIGDVDSPLREAFSTGGFEREPTKNN
jgi:hypothetical protein